ncbi:ARM repeat superfamily protein [Striga asiatica]|uniref:ARM repeat superfamily protein n=1 Tax=Striga asiatica TaxID=4170 RepID=A0A5A7P797_STRAF|nr:ARM repeat superfamily protein [Striga asiatica]
MSSAVRSWRTAFLTLRDETLCSPPGATVLRLLNQLILSQSNTLIAASLDLSPHEATSDFMLLMELAGNISQCQSAGDVILPLTELSQLEFNGLTQEPDVVLIHGISHCSSLEINSKSWAPVFDSFKRIVQTLISMGKSDRVLIGNIAILKATLDCLESIRCLFGLYQAAALLSENEQLLAFLLQVVGHFHGESIYDKHVARGVVCEVLTTAFAMIGEAYSRLGSSLPVDAWQSTIEVLRKVMDIVASKIHLLEDNNIAMFYIELLRCLHLVLTEPRGNLAGHVAGFVAALRIFLHYGLLNKPHVVNQVTNHKKEVGSTSRNLHVEVSNRSRSDPYRPPHLRKKIVGRQQFSHEDGTFSPKHDIVSSDSDYSDNDGSVIDKSSALFAKARLAAILCIQDLCQADPKSFTAQWTMLLPSNDVLQHRKYESTLLSCLLFDPNFKVRTAAGSTIVALLDGPASVSLQVAEFKGHSKCGSFTALSSSLGHILMQLHTGTLYLIKHETHGRMLALSFKILMLLISSTPYSRMSTELLPGVIFSVQSTIEEGFPHQSDRNSLLAAAINCLSLALSVSPSSTHVNSMLLGEISTGSLEGQKKTGVLNILFRYSEQLSIPQTSLEAFQALKAAAHNYPNVMALCWEQISSITYRVLSSGTDVPVKSWRAEVDNTAAPVKERGTAAAVKVLDECLRAISGFKGIEDPSNDKVLDSPFTSDYMKTTTISSAPSYNLKIPTSTDDETKAYTLASERWSEAINKHMPLIIKHSSAMSHLPPSLPHQPEPPLLLRRFSRAGAWRLVHCQKFFLADFQLLAILICYRSSRVIFWLIYIMAETKVASEIVLIFNKLTVKLNGFIFLGWRKTFTVHLRSIDKDDHLDLDPPTDDTKLAWLRNDAKLLVRAASVTCFAGMTSSVFFALPMDKQEFIISSLINAALNDEVPSVRSAACRAIGVIGCFQHIYNSVEVLEKFIHAAEHNTHDSLVSVRITASWALANICDSLSHCSDSLDAGKVSRRSGELISLLVDSALRLARDNDKVKANAVRAMGNLSRCIRFTSPTLVHDDPLDHTHIAIKNVPKDDTEERSVSFASASTRNLTCLEQMVQTFLSCVTTGNVKVQWNVCHALSNLFCNKTLKLQDMDWAASVFSILLLLLRDSSNFKIRIQAAAALAVPGTIDDYGKSYYDVVKSVEHVVENFKSDKISEPSNFKYWVVLEKQLTSTMLHLLSLAAKSDHQAIQGFLVKKASFLEVWIKDLCSSLGETSNLFDEAKKVVSTEQKRDAVLRTIRSLIDVYECCNYRQIAQKFDSLATSLL